MSPSTTTAPHESRARSVAVALFASPSASSPRQGAPSFVHPKTEKKKTQEAPILVVENKGEATAHLDGLEHEELGRQTSVRQPARHQLPEHYCEAVHVGLFVVPVVVVPFWAGKRDFPDGEIATRSVIRSRRGRRGAFNS